jgi:hypothetical protein
MNVPQWSRRCPGYHRVEVLSLPFRVAASGPAGSLRAITVPLFHMVALVRIRQKTTRSWKGGVATRRDDRRSFQLMPLHRVTAFVSIGYGHVGTPHRQNIHCSRSMASNTFLLVIHNVQENVSGVYLARLYNSTYMLHNPQASTDKREPTRGPHIRTRSPRATCRYTVRVSRTTREIKDSNFESSYTQRVLRAM